MHRRLANLAAAVVALAVLTTPALAGPQPPAAPDHSSFARFEGTLIDLSQGWGDAQACLVDKGAATVQCFRDRADLRARESQLETQAVPALSAVASLTATCSAPLRLFADGSYGGRELDFYDRGYWQNLSVWGFDNQLSSYIVGGCGAYLADYANGGGSWYPGNTNAGHGEPVVTSGWNDRVSSIYIQ
jgi:hypothetical protein